MFITLSHRTAICQAVAEVWLTGEAPLGAVSHRFKLYIYMCVCVCVCVCVCINTNRLIVLGYTVYEY